MLVPAAEVFFICPASIVASGTEAGTATDSEAGVAEGEGLTAEGGDAQEEQSA
jgi:hypothetical protein